MPPTMKRISRGPNSSLSLEDVAVTLVALTTSTAGGGGVAIRSGTTVKMDVDVADEVCEPSDAGADNDTDSRRRR